MGSSLAIVRLRNVGSKQWSTAGLLSIKKLDDDRVHLEITGPVQGEAFTAGMTVEVHLPLGGCFLALLEAVVPNYFLGLRVLEFLDPSRCMDDLQHFGAPQEPA